MAEPEILYDFSPLMLVYKDGTFKRIGGNEVVAPSLCPKTKVESKDVVISKEPEISARLYLPQITNPDQKLPLLIYFHGGGFIGESPFSPLYHNYCNSLVSQANVICVSVHYRRAPEHCVPIAYEDSWAAIKWAASHFRGKGPDEWLNRYADFERVFFAGDSAGGNITNRMGIRFGTEGVEGLRLKGIVLVHPYFWGVKLIGSETARIYDEMWKYTCPTTSGPDDPFLNPATDPDLGKLGCERILVCVAATDVLRDRGCYYKELVEKSGWKGKVDGKVEITEAPGECHVFHLSNPTCENAVALLNRMVSFINQP